MSFHFQPAFVSLYTAIVQAKLPTASYTVTSTLSKVSIRVEWPLLRTLAVQLDGGKHRTLSHTCRLDILSLRRSTVPPRRTLCLTCSSLHSIIWPYLVFPSSTLNTSSIWSVCVCVQLASFYCRNSSSSCVAKDVCFFRASPSASVHLSQRQGRQTPCTLPNAVR